MLVSGAVSVLLFGISALIFSRSAFLSIFTVTELFRSSVAFLCFYFVGFAVLVFFLQIQNAVLCHCVLCQRNAKY